jgi:hypothetical protein
MSADAAASSAAPPVEDDAGLTAEGRAATELDAALRLK